VSSTLGISARIEDLDGEPVVRRSNNPGLQPGDTIIEIEGEPALDWYAARYPLVSAASDGYLHDLVTRRELLHHAGRGRPRHRGGAAERLDQRQHQRHVLTP
jgi:hypothetical protein